jgi:hypothetical protein
MRILLLLAVLLVAGFSYGIYSSWDRCLNDNATNPGASSVCWDRVKLGKL